MVIVTFVQQHWVEILAIIGAFDLVMGIVVKWTKCQWDDQAYTILHNWISQLSGKGK